jgi:transmembrane sensor
MANEKFSDETLLARWLSGELDAAEESALRARSDFADYEKIVAAMEKISLPAYDAQQELGRFRANLGAESTTDSAVSDLRGAQTETSSTKKSIVRQLRPWVAAAAVVAAVLAVWFLFPFQPNEFATAPGVTEVVELPEGSTVRLNAESKMRFEQTEGERQVALTGEAFFEVEKSVEPFSVNTSLGTVTVLGTAFNVYARDGFMEVGCTEGRVSVSFDGVADAFILTPGKSVAYTEGQAPMTTDTLPQGITDWLDGISKFSDRPLAEVLAELTRQYDLQLMAPEELLNREGRVSTTFPNDNLPLALEAIFEPTQLTYKLEGRRLEVLAQE